MKPPSLMRKIFERARGVKTVSYFYAARSDRERSGPRSLHAARHAPPTANLEPLHSARSYRRWSTVSARGCRFRIVHGRYPGIESLCVKIDSAPPTSAVKSCARRGH
ncbi:hypothetical protein EVAR_20778_1 [Eumeta japonica]|uniref:Uncharacterized protein n=1 Tax=Eumeta variegata TaxID=151549 RepID=A0A4C1UEU7_EUMVA|nr:hypothetical protein EVAR_20778_1 [Eumeta japonica]